MFLNLASSTVVDAKSERKRNRNLHIYVFCMKCTIIMGKYMLQQFTQQSTCLSTSNWQIVWQLKIKCSSGTLGAPRGQN